MIVFSGVGKVERLSEVFEKTKAEAPLSVVIFHRKELRLEELERQMNEWGNEVLKFVRLN
jgi:imidazole glycerol phosphate synthase subunit HisF